MIRAGRLATVAALIVACPTGTAIAQATGTCPETPPPVVTLDYASRYAEDDAARATLDPDRAAEAEAALAPLDAFIDDLVAETGALYEGRSRSRAAAAACIVGSLGVWAQADALSKLETETVKLTIGSRYAAFAMVLWQTLPYAPDHPDRTVVLAWLERRVREQMVFWPEAPSGSLLGNLRAWAGLAAAAVSVQSTDTLFRDWAAVAVHDVVCSADPDGSLPQEMSRGRFALHYQLHAIAPLVAASVLLERQGVPVSSDCDGALHRVVAFALNDLHDGRATRAITGADQSLFEGGGKVDSFQLAWLEPYMLLNRSDRIDALRKAFGPFNYSKLGGNQTEIWGR